MRKVTILFQYEAKGNDVINEMRNCDDGCGQVWSGLLSETALAFALQRGMLTVIRISQRAKGESMAVYTYINKQHSCHAPSQGEKNKNRNMSFAGSFEDEIEEIDNPFSSCTPKMQFG